MIAVLRKSGKINIHFDKMFFYAFFKQSYPYALLIFLMAFYNRFDSVLIDALLPDEKSQVPEFMTGHFQAGVYAQAYRILDGISQFGYLFAVLLLPIFARMIKLKENLGGMVLLSYSLIIVPAVIITISSSVYSQEVMSLLYKDGTKYSAPIFSVIIYGFIAICTTYIFGTLLTANGSLKALNIMALFGISINILVNLLLIPNLKGLGAAYSSLITQSITAIVQVAIAYRVFKLNINYTFIFKMISLVALTYFLALFTKSYFDTFLYAFGITIAVSTIYAMSIRLLHLKGLLAIIKDSQA